MLTSIKKTKLTNALKAYKKRYIDSNLKELDESGTRLMINSFLSEVLAYEPISEIKTEYMIKGTYADYVIQTGGTRHFLVEVKALSLQLSDKHLRQTINYGANEGIEWALLTNGKNFELYKILFNKPIESRRIFSIDLSDGTKLKEFSDQLEYLHRDAMMKKSLKQLWIRFEMLHINNIAGILFSSEIISAIKKIIRRKCPEKFDDREILSALHRIALEKIDPAVVKIHKSAGRAPKALTIQAIEKAVNEKPPAID